MMLGRLMQELCKTPNVDRHTAAREPFLNLLQQPTIDVRIAEGDKRVVAAMLRVRTSGSDPPKQVGLVGASVDAAFIVEHLAHIDAMRNELLACSPDIRDD